MRRVFVISLVLALALLVVGCGASTATTTTAPAAAVTTSAPTTAAQAVATTTTVAPTTTETNMSVTPSTDATTTTTTESGTSISLSEFYKTYSGTGSKIVNLGTEPDGHWFILALTTKATTEVKVFDSSGQETYFPGNDFSLGSDVNTYHGRVMGRPEIVKVQINTKGAWTLEVQPLSAATQLKTPGTLNGNSEDVIELTGNPSSLNISGDPKDVFGNFIVEYFQQGDSFGSGLVNELGKYEGVAVVAGDGWVTVQASFPWTITSAQ